MLAYIHDMNIFIKGNPLIKGPEGTQACHVSENRRLQTKRTSRALDITYQHYANLI